MAKNNPQTYQEATVSVSENGVDSERLWQAADKLRGSIDAAEYKHVVLGLIFLKYISDSFEARRAKLAEELAADGIEDEQAEKLLESRDEYSAENVFWVPPEARWKAIQNQARQANIATLIDDAMYAIERDNPKLKGKLPRDYARRSIPPERLGGLIDMIGSIAIGTDQARAKDVLGRVYEYFLGKFAAAEGKLGGEFFTPRSVVRLLVEMIEPYEGRVYDPCCGSGGMFVQSEKFVAAHGGSQRDISIFGQESNSTTWRLAHMNLAIRGIEANLGKQPADSFVRDLHPDLKADYILANPPFNISDWSGQLLRDDARWKFGVPPSGNANYAWIQHFIYHLAPPNGHGGGIAGFVMANGSLSSNTGGEGEIRQNIIEADLADCIIAMPGQLFLTTGIPVCLWFIARNKSGQPSPRPSPKGRGSAEQHRGGYAFEGLKQRARELRTKQTPPEIMFWELVRDRRFMDLKFRRQHQIGDYIADFYCHEHKLVVELDGEVHLHRQQRDQKRDAWLRSQDLTVLRFKNEEFVNDPEKVLADIASTVCESPPSTSARDTHESRDNDPPSTPGRGAGGEGCRDRRGETLFIDARQMGTLETRTLRVLSGRDEVPLPPDSDIGRIARTYHAWRTVGHHPASGHPLPRGEGQSSPPSTSGRGVGGEGKPGMFAYSDIPGFCKSSKLDEIRKHGHVLTPGRYVGAAELEDDGEPFEEKMQRLTAELQECFEESDQLQARIKANLEGVGYGG